jgi:hypothetical protein
VAQQMVTTPCKTVKEEKHVTRIYWRKGKKVVFPHVPEKDFPGIQNRNRAVQSLPGFLRKI